MIQIEGLSIAFQGKPLFVDATFSIQQGEKCGLVGRNGSGKSTLLRLIIGQETPDKRSISIKKHYRVGSLEQHIQFQKPTIIEEASLGLRSEEHGIHYAEKILFGLGFKEEDMQRPPKEFSGGFHLRLHLAKALIAEPDCLLLDEPTNYLDILSIRWLTKFLKSWKGEFILISHDREFMDAVTTHTMGIHREKVRKIKGDTVAFYNQILQEEEIHERTRVNLEKKRSHAQSFVDRFGAKATKAAQAQSRKKMIDRIPVLEKLMAIQHLNFHFNEAPFVSKKMMEVQNLSFSYVPSSSLIQNVSFSIEKGDRIAIIGKNGYGKSTLLRVLAQELTPTSGSIKASENIKMGYFGQTNIDRLHPKHTVEEEIAIANPDLNVTEVKGICGLMMFSGDKSTKLTSVLSGGERSRVLLGKILASPCNLLLLDEPTHHLDMESIEALIDALEDFEGAIVLVTHSELILKRLALDKLIVCKQNNQDFFVGAYEDFLEKKGWEEEAENKPAKKAADYKENKQFRAEMINARSRALKPVDEQIGKTEKKILELEKEQKEAEKLLIDHSQSGQSKAIQEISKEMGLRSKMLEKLYEDLEALLVKREEILNQFNL